MPAEVPPIEQRWETVRKILDSEHFKRSPKLRALLTYLCEESLTHGRVVHEQQIGHKIYDRGPEYTPGEDSIVRVEVSNLRKRLQDYFDSEGRNERISVTIPRGTYVPRFEYQRTANRFGVLVMLLVVGLLVLGISFVWGYHGWGWVRGREILTPAPPNPLWAKLFDGVHHTYIVTADSGWALVQDLLGTSFSLEDYLSQDFPEDDLPAQGSHLAEAVRFILSRQYTSVADLQLVAKTLSRLDPQEERISVRSARNMRVRDFKEANVILLGSVRSNPWVELFEEKLNFRLRYDPVTRTAFVFNKLPLPGEEAMYTPASRSSEDYAVMCLAPNLDGHGAVLMIAGTGMTGTEAAGEMFTNPELGWKLIRELNLHSQGQLRCFEVLLRSSIVEGAPTRADVIAHRVPPD